MQVVRLHDWLRRMLSLEVPVSPTQISGFAIDSREVLPGDLFFALPGARTSGLCFLRHAAQAGAVAAIVPHDYHGPHFGMALVKVPDPREALREAGKQKALQCAGDIVGITGSLGKTTTKYFAQTLLSAVYKTFASPKSYNSQLTVPLSLLMAEGDERCVLLEMGVSEPGDMGDLLSVVAPDIALITCISEQHLSHFEERGVEGILEEKAQILHQSSLQILPKDSPWFSQLVAHGQHAEMLSFALFDSTADFHYVSMNDREVMIQTPHGLIQFAVSFPYLPAYYNLLVAVALCWVLQVPDHCFFESGHQLHLPPMRFETIKRKGVMFINDAYNACPEAMLAALQALPQPSQGGKVILILGEMVALGSQSEMGHVVVAQKALACANMIFFVGERWDVVRSLCAISSCETYFYSSAEEVGMVLPHNVKEGDVVLLKGSRSVALESLLSIF